MHNGAQQPTQHLAGPRSAYLEGQQASIVSGIPFTHYGTTLAGDGRIQMNQNGMRSHGSFPSNQHSVSRGEAAPVSANNHPPSRNGASAPLGQLPHSLHALPQGQGYMTHQRVVSDGTNLATTNHALQSSMRRHSQPQPTQPNAPAPQTYMSTPGGYSSHVQAQPHPNPSNAGTSHPQMARPAPLPSYPPPQPRMSIPGAAQVLAAVHQHYTQAAVQEFQSMREQQSASSSQAPPPPHAPQASQASQTPQPPRAPPASQVSQGQPSPYPSDPSRQQTQFTGAPGQQPQYAGTQGQRQPQSTSVQAPQQAQSASTSGQPQGAAPDGTTPRTLSLLEGSSIQARQLIEPLRRQLCDGLGATHQSLTTELARLHTMISQRDAALHQAKARADGLREERDREREGRLGAERRCEELQAQRERAEQEMRKMTEHVPKLLLEFYEVRAERDRLSRELEALREANSQLREKAAVVREGGVDAFPFEFPEDQKALVKAEESSSSSDATRTVKVERDTEGNPSAEMANYDAEVAQALAMAHEERKRRQRAERELHVVKNILHVAAPLPQATSSVSTEYVPPTPEPDQENSRKQSGITTPDPGSMDTDAAPEQRCPPESETIAKVETKDDTPMLWSATSDAFPSVIDLTDMPDSSPMQLTSELPPLARAATPAPEPERKRSFDVASGSGTQELRPEPKRQRTLDVQVAHNQLEEGEIPPTPTEGKIEPEVMTAGDVTMTDALPAAAEHVPSHPTPPAHPDTPAGVHPATTLGPPPFPVWPEPALPAAPAPATSTGVAEPSTQTQRSEPQPAPPPAPAPLRASLPDSLAGLSLPSTSAAVTLPGQQLPPTPTSPASPEAPKRFGMRHVPLVYETKNGRMTCRLCHRRLRDEPRDGKATLYVLDGKTATWDDIAGHCERAHPAAFKIIVKLTADQILEHERALEPLGPLRRYEA